LVDIHSTLKSANHPTMFLSLLKSALETLIPTSTYGLSKKTARKKRISSPYWFKTFKASTHQQLGAK